jgi:hypothetical protein
MKLIEAAVAHTLTALAMLFYALWAVLWSPIILGLWLMDLWQRRRH